MIFTWSQPCRISSRTAFCTSATPSARPMAKASALQQWQRTPGSVRLRPSLCPPVGPSALPAMNSRGPGQSPCSTAVLIPQSAPPVSRTVVKPRSSMPRIRCIARAVIRVSGMLSSRPSATSLNTTWTWQSIRPGIRVRPPQSTTSAEPAAIGRSDTSLIDPVLDQQLEPALEPVALRIQHLKVSKEVLGQARSPGRRLRFAVPGKPRPNERTRQ